MSLNIRGPGHKKQNLPPSLAAAELLIREMGLPPSAVIHSGHGLQAWWFLKEPWLFESDEERAAAAKLVKGWTATLRARAREHGWDADATGDLSRVFRLPGLWNRKGAPVPTRLVLLEPGRRYAADDFEGHMLAESAQDDGPLPDLEWRFKLSPEANPPADKFFLLGNADPMFWASWDHKRADLADQSASSYDLALATRAHMAGWSAQDIVNLLVAHRRHHKEDLKLREDYYRKTLNRAAKGKGAQERQRWIDELKAGNELPAEIVSDRAEMLAIISGALGFRVTKVVRYLGDPTTYDIDIHGTTVKFGIIDNLDIFARFRRIFANATKKLLERHKGKAWDRIVQYLLDAVEDVECGQEATHGGAFATWLQEYIAFRLFDEEHVDDALRTGAPFTKGGHVHVTTKGLGRFLSAAYRENLSSTVLAKKLRESGAAPVVVGYRSRHGARTTANTFQIPPSIYRANDFPKEAAS